MNRFERVLSWQGFPISAAKTKLEQIKIALKSNAQDYTETSKWSIFNYHKSHNSHYRQLLNNQPISCWEDIPIMTKQDLQVSLEQRLSKDFSAKSVYVNKTSGSSGHPFIFAKDKAAHALTWAHIISLYQQHDIDMSQSYEARFYGIPKDFISNKKERLKDVFAHRFRFDIFDLSDDKLEDFLKEFKRKPFELINGYTSSIVMFAKFLQSKQISLKAVCPSLKACITTSEMLFDSDRKLLEDVLGVTIINEYGASELDVIAFENTEGEWQINNKTLLVEVVDDHHKVLPNGEEGHLVVTSLYNKAHPFIRYKIGDVGVISKKSTAEHQILKKLTGRTNQFAILPSGKRIPALSFYYVTKSVIEDSGDVKEIKVIQETEAEFKIEYVSENELTDRQKSKITKAIETYLEPNLKVSFKKFTTLERSKSGKLKQFISKLNQHA
ncbi:phenylacetate-CoA ligase [Psychroflexus salarius]|uniref:Phenylacetate-CoA ligase n=1 Tax=Psychroflexus salarius TaxID=1155689 RepID=A0A1M4UTK8_9FLAO|nr:phenylacetate--CoA ligase family protein [Psychroflexus salarius]SHE59930.1 phenylacetate-CoA ligase [Psychroflexus salarius]